MGSLCPKCSNQNAVDFGMAQCDVCQMVFYVNVDGSVNYDDGSLAPVDSVAVNEQNSVGVSSSAGVQEVGSSQPHSELNEQFIEPSLNENYISQGGLEESLGEMDQNIYTQSAGTEEHRSEVNWAVDHQEPQETPYAESEVLSGDLDYLAPQNDSSLAFEATLEPENEASVDVHQHNEIPSAQNADQEWGQVTDQEPAATEGIGLGGLREEVVDFGNSEKSSIREGAISYELEISGLDTNEEKDVLRSILEDKKLLISVEEKMTESKSGSVTIENLNPIKAAVIVSGLHNTNIQVVWRQIVFND